MPASVLAQSDQQTVSKRDRTILRDMAGQVAEAAAHPCQEEKARLWQQHNDLALDRPLVLAFPEGAWEELLAADGFEHKTESAHARQCERFLYEKLYYWEHIKDDSVIEPVIPSPVVVRNSGFAVPCSTTSSGAHKGAQRYNCALESLDDIEKLEPPAITVDWDETRRLQALNSELFGDILTVRQYCAHPTMIAPLDIYIHWRGIENLFTDLIANPQMVHAAVSKMVDAFVDGMRTLEREGALRLNNRGHYIGSGGTGFTAQLPQPGMPDDHVRVSDLWGSATAQIFSEISPQMHEEFALAHEKRFLELFGLSCYGCCEPLHLKLDLLFKHIPNLRRISISPWADIGMSAEKLGRDYIFSWKPNPVLVSSPDWDPGRVRDVTRGFLEKTKGCITEIIMKDTHTVHNDPRRIDEWVRITREMIDEAHGL
ncbi:MAG: hypothetical protein GF331_26730 [Chitinivibrionales bacterium]|nr:hypothetical protein [Chitinivibrionales bacterium]